MSDQFEKYCNLVFTEIKNEISNDSFRDMQRVLGMWPLPKDFKLPDRKSGYLMFPNKGLCIIEAPFPNVGNFKISVSIKMGEVRLGFLFPPDFSDLIDQSHVEIEEFIAREYSYNPGRDKKTLTNFSTTPSGNSIIDFIFYDQFADLSVMSQVISKNAEMGGAIARSTSMTLSHLYCSLISCLLIERVSSQDGIVEDDQTINRDLKNETQRIYVLIDPTNHVSKSAIEDKISELDGIFKSLHDMQEDSKVLHIIWPTLNQTNIHNAEKELRRWSYSMKSEIHLYEQFEDHIDLSDVLPIDGDEE